LTILDIVDEQHCFNMVLTVWFRNGIRKSIYLPYESIDKVKEYLYNYKDSIITYCIGIVEMEKTKEDELS